MSQDMCVIDYGEDMAYWKVNHICEAKIIFSCQIDEIWMEFCCEEKLTEKKDFIERETKKYEYVEDEEVIEDFGQVFRNPLKSLYLII